MAKTKGACNHSKLEKTFIRQNWNRMTDLEMSKTLGYNEAVVIKMRYFLGISRFQFKMSDKKTIAHIIELYANGKSIKEINAIVGKRKGCVDNVIKKHWIPKKLNNRTIEITYKSNM